jgi:uncharacterized membrane protein YhhN
MRINRWGAVYAAASVAEVGARAARWRRTANAIKPMLMPALLAWALRASREESGPGIPRLLLVGLIAATAGDILLLGGQRAWFLAGMLAFLVMQGAYGSGFARLGAVDGLRRSPRPAVAYGAVWLGANVALGPRLGSLRGPVAGYSLALAAMAALAAGLGAQGGAGGALFLLSDALIGARVAGLEVPAGEALVMATYLAAQYLLVSAWLGRLDPGHAPLAP